MSLTVPRFSPSLPGVGSALSFAVVGALASNFLFVAGHDLQRCIEVVMLCLVAIIVLGRAALGQKLVIPSSVSGLLLTFFALGLISAATAFSLRHAVYEWSSLLLLLILVVAIATELAREGKRLPRLLHWIGIACGLYTLKLIIMYAAALASGFQVDLHTLAVGFSNGRFLNHAQTALMPLIVLLYLRAPLAGRWRKAWFVLAAFWWALLFVCESRATILALVAGCAAAVALRRAHARSFVLAMAWTALTGTVLYALLFILLPVLAGLQPISMPLNVVARTAADPTSARNLLWKLAWELIASHPWLGVGPQHYAHEGASLYTAAHPHNWVLQIAAEWGIPALLCLIGVIFVGARALVRSGARVAKDDRSNQQILVTLLVACTAIFVDGLVSGVIVMPQSQLAIAIVLGIACAWVRLQAGHVPHAKPIPSALTRTVFAALVISGLFGLIWSVAPDIAARARGDVLTPAELAVNPTKHWPRMWEAGFF
jgi:putative inorganic carbon (HCO3(-)) transporter